LKRADTGVGLQPYSFVGSLSFWEAAGGKLLHTSIKTTNAPHNKKYSTALVIDHSYRSDYVK
jgi:hypothetical protein